MLYIVYVNLFDRGYFGIKKKIFAQIKVFEKEFGNVYYTTYCGQIMYLMLNGQIVEKSLALTKKECNRLLALWIEKYSISKTYIRYAYSDLWFINYLEWQKKKGIKSVLEFPTIPYDKELSNKRLIAEDKYYRRELSKFVSQCTTFSDFDEVFGIPCIPLLNGVDIDKNPMRRYRKPDGNIVLLAVASMAKWHGYERVIEGLAAYYKENGERNILFKLVGEGPETSKYRNMVKSFGLEQYVEFCGKIEGKELDRQYDEADIAVGTLGMYKIEYKRGAPIKLREYCARGIPFIYAYEDLGFNGNERYLINFPNNNEKLNMQDIIEFYEKVKEDKMLIYEMHNIAKDTFTWSGILKPIIKYFM